MTRADRRFFARDTIDVARDLLGQFLVRTLPTGEERRGRIIETEAYLGTEDPAAHSAGGRRTPRVEAMYGEPGIVYVYLIYGIYHCLNFSTVARDVPEAVLIRALALEPGAGDPRSASGPGKLCRAFAIDKSLNHADATTSAILRVELEETPRHEDIWSGPRVGIGDRHDAVHWPLRFILRPGGPP